MGACSSVPSEPSLAQVLWEAFGAVPVLPFQPGLTVFSVLVKDKAGCFCQIGDLGSLCAGEGQANLQNLIANTQSITKTQELGSIDQMVANSSRLSSRLLVFQTGAVAGLENVHTWRISVPSHQRIYADAVTVARMLREFILDKTDPDVKGKKKMAVWVVTELITAPSVSAYAFDGRGVNIGVGISLPNGGVPADLEISLRGEGVATQFLFRKGPEVNGTPQPLPVAFRGWKYQYQNGRLTDPTQAVFGSDAVNGPPLDGAPAEPSGPVRAPTPFNDPHMADLVVGDEWFTTILADKDLRKL